MVLLHVQRPTLQDIAMCYSYCLKEWVSSCNNIHGYMVTDTSNTMLAVMKAVCLKVCLAYMLHLVVKDLWTRPVSNLCYLGKTTERAVAIQL